MLLFIICKEPISSYIQTKNRCGCNGFHSVYYSYFTVTVFTFDHAEYTFLLLPFPRNYFVKFIPVHTVSGTALSALPSDDRSPGAGLPAPRSHRHP